MDRSPVKEKLARGEASIGTWISAADPVITEVLCSTGLDWMTFDLEHNAIDFRTLLHCLHAMKGSDKVPFARVPWNDPQVIKRVLDIGCMGVVVPDVKSVEEADQAVRASRYSPQGFRGIGSSRGTLVHGPDYYQRANDEICVVVMIESVEAVEDIDRILAVPGIDVAFIGPNDLASSMGVPLGLDNQHPDHVGAVQRVVDAGRKAGIPVGIHCGDGAEVGRRIRQGMQWLPLASEVRMIRWAIGEELKNASRVLAETDARAGEGANGKAGEPAKTFY